MRWCLVLLIFSCASIQAQLYLTPQFSTVDIIPNIAYGEADRYDGSSQTLLLDFYAPSTSEFIPRPLVIYAHGGGFVDQNQTKNLPHIQNYCDSLARRGYAVASIEYRLDTVICNRAIVNAMHDMRAAVRFFKTESSFYGIDSTLIFVTGESAGAITALSTAYVDQEDEVFQVSEGPLASEFTVEGLSGNPNATSSIKAALSLCGGTLVTGSGIVFDTLAMQTAQDPPLVIVHGSADLLVPITGALDLAVRANNLNIPSLFYVLPEATHCPWFTGLPSASAYMDTLILSTVPFMYNCVTSVVDEVSENRLDEMFRVHPVPATDVLRISSSLDGQFSIKVFDISGRLMSSETRFSGSKSNSLDLTDYPPGNYVLNVETDYGRLIRQIVKK